MDLLNFYSTVLSLVVLLAVGFVGGKAKILGDGNLKGLSTLTLKIAQPFMIIGAMINVEFSTERLKKGLLVIAIGLAVHVVIAVIAHFSVFRYKNEDEKKVAEFAAIFANCGFVGFPIIESFLGAEGLFYAGFYIISFNIFIWSWGVVIFGRGRDDIKINAKTMLLNYGTVPSIIGIILFVTRLPIPVFLSNATSTLGALCTPLSMLVTGALIANTNLKEFFLNLKTYYICFIKLIIMPVVVALLSFVCRLDVFFISLFTVMSALPTASSTVMYAEMYDVSKKSAAVITGMCTLLSMATLPLIVKLLELIFY